MIALSPCPLTAATSAAKKTESAKALPYRSLGVSRGVRAAHILKGYPYRSPLRPRHARLIPLLLDGHAKPNRKRRNTHTDQGPERECEGLIQNSC